MFLLDNFELVLDQMEEDIEKFLAITFRDHQMNHQHVTAVKGYKSPTALITKMVVGLVKMVIWDKLHAEIKFDEQILSAKKRHFIDTRKERIAWPKLMVHEWLKE